MEQWHLTLASRGRQHAFPNDVARLAAARVIARIGGVAGLLFCVVDDHAHVVWSGVRTDAGRLGRGLLLALRTVLPDAGMLPAHVEPVEDRRHLYRLVRYILRQTDHHGLPSHPARWVGSCFADLVGARVLPGFEAGALQHALPRLTLEEVCDAARVHRAAIEPFRDDGLRDVSLREIASAAAAAVGRTALAGNTPHEVGARRVASRLMASAGAMTAQMADVLGITPRSASRLPRQPASPRLERAVRVQLTLRGSVPERQPAVRLAE